MSTKTNVWAAAAVLLLTPAAHADTLRFSTAGPAGAAGSIAMKEMADRLAADQSVDLTMEVFPSNQLGDETETIKQVARGRIDLGGYSITAAATVVPEVSVMISPYFWQSSDEAKCAMDNGLGEVLEPYFLEKGLKPILWHDLGWQIFFAKDAILDPEDVRGYKVRVSPAKNHEMFWRATGASGIALPFAETATGLQTGIVDGGELPIVSFVATGMGQLAPHLMTTNHVYQPLVYLISTKSWDKLSPEQQASFEAELPEASAVNAEVRAQDARLLEKFQAEGGTLHDLTAEQRAKWQALWTEDLQQELIASIGGDAQIVYDAAVAARAACRD